VNFAGECASSNCGIPRRDPRVGRRKLKPVESRVETTWYQRLKLECDEPLSNGAFNFDVCRCTMVRLATPGPRE